MTIRSITFTLKNKIGELRCNSPEEKNSNEIIDKATKFFQDGCGCVLGEKGGQCSTQFSEETVLVNLNNCLELTSGEHDLVILANVQAFTHIDCVGQKRNGSSYPFKKISIRLNGSSYPFKKISLRSNGSSYPFKKISIRSNGSSYPFKKISIRLNGSSCPFKKYRQPFEISI